MCYSTFGGTVTQIVTPRIFITPYYIHTYIHTIHTCYCVTDVTVLCALHARNFKFQISNFLKCWVVSFRENSNSYLAGPSRFATGTYGSQWCYFEISNTPRRSPKFEFTPLTGRFKICLKTTKFDRRSPKFGLPSPNFVSPTSPKSQNPWTGNS